jgi:phage terminase large subunit
MNSKTKKAASKTTASKAKKANKRSGSGKSSRSSKPNSPSKPKGPAPNKWLPDIVGKGYKDFWNFKGRYRVCKGSRASKKSKTTALNYISGLIEYPQANLLVIRKTFRTLKDSCYAELKWAIHRLGVDAFFHCNKSPLEITYLPTGQKIYFRGLDDPLKITSITVDVGYLCWMWIEEAYEISNEDDFNILDESIRGEVPEGLFKQITLTFNPWNEAHWIKKRFFDAAPDEDILAKTTNYLCNEFLDAADKKVFETMRINNPRRYKVAGLGEWGIVDGLIYENWEEREFNINEVSSRPNVKSAFGLDFGYTNDPSALFCGLIDEGAKEIYVFDEIYKKALLNRMIADEIKSRGYAKEKITADCAEPKSIDELRELGLSRIKRSRKGKDSVNNGVQFIQGFRVIIHPRCVSFLTEISNYTWDKDKFGKTLNKPVDDFNHLMDAMRYALEDFNKGDTFSFD